MKVGIIMWSMDVAALAQSAEVLGFDSFWVAEWVVFAGVSREECTLDDLTLGVFL